MTRFTGTRYETELKNILSSRGFNVKNLGQNEAGDLLVMSKRGLSIIEVKSTSKDRFYYDDRDQLEELKRDSEYVPVYLAVRFLRRRWRAYELDGRIYGYDDGFSLEDLISRL